MEERRGAPRFARDDTVAVKILASPARSELVGSKVQCSTVDVSAGGMQLVLAHPLTVGCKMALEVEVLAQGGTYFLGGEVVWSCETATPGTHYVGVRLLEDDCFELARWRLLFA